jgi:hypothetical protein
LEQVVRDMFGIRGVPLAHLWPRISERHELLFGGKSIEEIY